MNKFLDIYKQPVPAKALMNMPGFSNVHGNPYGIPLVESNVHRPRNFMVPLQLERIKTDLESWRLAIAEAENAYYPHRFRMQQLLIDVILEGHTMACIKKRKSLTLLKKCCIGKQDGNGAWKENKEATALFQKKWFKELLSYGLDAQFYGYSLIQLGDLAIEKKSFDFKNLTILKRWHVSPDRKQLVQIPYQTWGLQIEANTIEAELKRFKEADKKAVSFTSDKDDEGRSFDDWLIYIDTPSDTGASVCGYGLLYNVALYSIILKSNLIFNANFNQMFVAPYRHIKTDFQFDTDEYRALERSAAQMGSFGYLLTGSQDEVDFINGNTGNGYKSYGDLEKRCQQMISKMILGHADAIDSKATSLGGGRSGKSQADDDSTAEGQALIATEKEQDDFAYSFLNDICYPKFQKLGFPLKDDECFYFPNDKEDFDLRRKQDAANLTTAEVWQTAKSAGIKLSAEDFTKITGLAAEDVPEPEKPVIGGNKEFLMSQKAKLDKIYSFKK